MLIKIQRDTRGSEGNVEDFPFPSSKKIERSRKILPTFLDIRARKKYNNLNISEIFPQENRTSSESTTAKSEVISKYGSSNHKKILFQIFF